MISKFSLATAPAVIPNVDLAAEASEARASFRQSYHEISNGQHIVEMDVIEQLRTNLAHLEDLHGRFHFLMSEVSYLLKK